MTGNDYINQNRTETLKKGDKVVMHTCYEAQMPKYKDKLWTCETDSFLSKGKEEVVFINKNGNLETEDGYDHGGIYDEFWGIYQKWQTGWSIYEEK